ncbi:peritrophin-1-like [Spodoptera frugiperda]|uniref:Peritrophin-1-like n=1 Tax=Spodoptera frugiperda TaxID=7108 RepID=A0A9R0ED29_SPOFR|nr:peritrophin-1-like [Spodoptera frugiperda]
MKGIIASLVILYAAVGRAQLEECPKEQEANGDVPVLLKHKDCDKFFLCRGEGEGVEMNCPSGLFFNKKTMICDWPENVNCEGRNIPVVSNSTTTTTTSTVPPIEIPDEFLPNGCPANPRIHWLLPHQTDCNAFYYCVWGGRVMRNCPPTLHFNRKLQVCDWPWAAGCSATFNKHLESRQSLR